MATGILVSIGVSLAVGAASSAIASALTPAQKIDRGGLSDLSIPKSNYGTVIPQCWGEVKLAGNLLWSGFKQEVTRTSRQGGKGAPAVETTERSYFQSFAVELAYCPHRPAESLQQLYLGSKLVYDATATDPETISASQEFASRYMRFYNGDPNQPVDPLMQSVAPTQSYDYGLPHDPTEREAALTALGLPPNLNHIPAYRKKVIIIFENLPLADYGNQLPVVKANVLFNSNNSLETIVTDICNQSNISNFDTSLLSNTFVPGFYINNLTEAKQIVRTLQQAYFFDILKLGDTIHFIPYTHARAVIPIPKEDLASRQGGQARPTTFDLPRPDPEDLPESVEITFIDKENSQESGNVIARSQISGSKRKENYSFPIVMSSSEAQKIADNLLYQFYLKAIKPPSLQLPRKYAYLEVGDRLEISFYDEPYILQITKIAMGANMLLRVDTEVVEAANLTSIASNPTPINSGGFNPPVTQTQTIRNQGNTNLKVMDINLISDTDADYGVYVSANGGSAWRECSIYVSNDDVSYYFADALSSAGTIGTLASALDANSTSFTVTLESGELESISTADYNAGVNKLLVGNEILQFQDVTINGNNRELTTLRRGIRGTETFINSHSIGDRVILLSGNGAVIKRIQGTQADIGQTRYFKAPSPGQTLDQAIAVPVVIQGNGLKPYAPINASATRDGIGNITISWDRRDRKAGDNTNNLPLSEIEEKWEVDIMNGAAVARTLTANESSVPYSIAYQNTDFGFVQTTINVRIYQISAVVPRGYSLDANLNTTFVESTPIITEFYPTVGQPGDTITVIGSGLAGVTAAQIGAVAATNLAVVSDNEITFIAATGTTTGKIELTAPGGTTTSDAFFNVLAGLDLSDYMKKSDYLDSNGLIKQAVIAYPFYDDTTNPLTAPYTLQATDIGKELVFENQTGRLNIPNTAINFVKGWGVVVSLEGTGDLEILRVDGTTTGLVFSGGEDSNHLKTQGTIAIHHRGNNIWLIVGANSNL